MEMLTAAELDRRVEAELAAWRAAGGRVLAYVGSATPVELVAAAGFLPYRLSPRPARDRRPDPVLLPPRVRALTAELLAGDGAFDAAVIGRGRTEDIQLFAVLRELGRLGQGFAGPVTLVDALVGGGETRDRYNNARLEAFQAWLATAGRAADDAAVRAAVAQAQAVRDRLDVVLQYRRTRAARLSGAETWTLISAIARLPVAAALTLLQALADGLARRAPVAGRRVVATGSSPEGPEVYAALEQAGLLVVGEDFEDGEDWAKARLDPALDARSAIVRRWAAPSHNAPAASSRARAEAIVARAQAAAAEAIVFLAAKGDEAAAWDAYAVARAAAEAGLPVLRLATPPVGEPVDLAALSDQATARQAPPVAQPSPAVATASRDAAPRLAKPAVGARSRKSLACTAEFGAWQRAWFAGVQARAKAEPFAVVNADAPQEILRTFDLPYVVNQWWASIVAAKQHGRRYGAALMDAGYPADAETYSAQGLAAVLVGEEPDAPWGGLPTPKVLSLVSGGSDAGTKIYEAWAVETAAERLDFDRTAEVRWNPPVAWWDDLPERWAQTLEPERLDLFTAELEDQVARLEAITGRAFDRRRFVQVMRLVNEQEHYYRRTRDLVAATRPAPISIADSMPATMVPQWHRGSEWGRDAARKLYEEVVARVAAGEAACPGEKLRLMWVGRGLWSDMGFYQRWEESHGAVFVWSMYLGLAADGYIREFEGEHDVMRALAARFVTMGDELRMPTWAGAWHVKEAQLHGVDAVVAIDDADPFVLKALEATGFPVCRLALGNMGVGGDEIEAKVSAFLDGLART
jgi:benzoyl-CoA reductase/2-hydroxyglutaryl-CoA dehydratase subunit BcrC/BadD/HgdB